VSLKPDEYYMKIAIRVASLGLGYTSPNPAVGAVLVDPKTGEVVLRVITRLMACLMLK